MNFAERKLINFMNHLFRKLIMTAAFTLPGSCIQLDPSLYSTSPVGMIMELLQSTESPKLYIKAYSSYGNKVFTYSENNPVWETKDYTGLSGNLSGVVRTESRFIGVVNNQLAIYTSGDGIAWNAVSSLPESPSNPPANVKVAACNNNVVIAYRTNDGNNVKSVYSTDGGLTFSNPAVTVFSGTSMQLFDLICDNNVFHISAQGAGSVTYKYSLNSGNSWNNPATNPAAVLRSLAANKNRVIGFYQAANPALSYSLNGGNDWTTGTTLSSTFTYALTYASGYFYAPDPGISSCKRNRSANGIDWNDNADIQNCSNTYNFFKVKGAGPFVVIGGSDNTEEVLLYSADGGENFSSALTATNSLGGISDILIHR